MGGFGSGRQGGRPTAEATASYIITIASFTRAGLRSGMFGTTKIEFEDREFPVEITVDTRDILDAHLRFTHGTRDYRDEQQATYRVNLTTTRPHYGGRRWWFVCPRTGRRSPKLFLPNGGWYFWSRRAYGLGYACQRETRADRLMRRARKLRRALGGDGGALSQCAPPKPKGMRWQTYERKLDAWICAEERANEAWAIGAMRLISRLRRLK